MSAEAADATVRELRRGEHAEVARVGVATDDWHNNEIL